MELSLPAIVIISAQALCVVVAIGLAIGCIRGIKHDRMYQPKG